MVSPSGFPQNFAIAENLLSQNEFDMLKVSEYFTELFELGLAQITMICTGKALLVPLGWCGRSRCVAEWTA